jgi:hypothetical protein
MPSVTSAEGRIDMGQDCAVFDDDGSSQLMTLYNDPCPHRVAGSKVATWSLPLAYIKFVCGKQKI